VRALPILFALLAACAIEHRAPAPAPPPPPPSPNDAKLIFPDDAAIPDGPEGAAIRRGRALVGNVRDSLPGQTKSALNCTSCHLDEGTRAWAAPWVGVYGRFPQYRARNARMNILEDRINDCFVRSLNGRALPTSGQDIRDIVAYMAWLSLRVPAGVTMEGQGFAKLKTTVGDTVAGREIFTGICSRCHGSDGDGTTIAPPLWGERSYNIGAGMARLRTAAAFIKFNMPYDNPGSLSEQQSTDVAAYINSRPRPDFAGKEKDWPNGDHPPDVPYVTRASREKDNPGGTPR
jgi:thiosulfate dehydrogenase